QAEDGIRDFHVTGVQTCALPIFEHVEGQFLRDQADALPHLPPIPSYIETECFYGAAGWTQQSTDRTNQCSLAGTVGAQQREYLALANLQIDPGKRRGAGLIGLRQIADIENRVVQSPAKMEPRSAIASDANGSRRRALKSGN